MDLLKNMTPPVFKGEDRERNKDAVNTYLHKWNELHTLRNTPDFLRAIESNLSLEGKAYKWYMSLSLQARTSTWSRYQDMFRKEFMPENEQSRNWDDWDVCQMGNLSLTQYISKYRGVILKVDGLDKFQKVRGFIRGLTKDIKKMVKSQYPKTLDKAIKDAQVYDDNIDKPPKNI